MTDGLGRLLNTQPPVNAHCEKHGEFESRNVLGSIWTKCTKCVEEQNEAERIKAERDAEEAQKARWLARIGMSEIPERFTDKTLDSFIATTEKEHHILSVATGYADDFPSRRGQSMLLLGKPGAGKTHIAAGVALSVMRQHGSSVLFTTVMRAIRKIRSTWGSRTESEDQVIDSFVFPALLILDEVGVQYGSESERVILFDIINERYERRKPTIFISNLMLDEVRAYLGERVFDRLREDGGKVLVFDWESKRGKL